MDWTWDFRKAITNVTKHGVTFELAAYVFADPLHVSEPDPYPYENRWQTIGYAGPACLHVVHTLIEPDFESGRIISARPATKHERRRYERRD
jgi:uncharacterized protein